MFEQKIATVAAKLNLIYGTDKFFNVNTENLLKYFQCCHGVSDTCSEICY